MLSTAGFQDVEVLKEIPFSIDCMLNDPTAKTILGDTRVPRRFSERIGEFIISVYLCGIKPE
jgi:hypothetical protein